MISAEALDEIREVRTMLQTMSLSNFNIWTLQNAAEKLKKAEYLLSSQFYEEE